MPVRVTVTAAVLVGVTAGVATVTEPLVVASYGNPRDEFLV
jgi:hypothetical protein